MRWCTPAYFGRASVKLAAISTRPAPKAPAHAAELPPPGAGCCAASASSRSCSDWSANAPELTARLYATLEEPNGSTFLIDVDVERGRALAEARHLGDVAAERHQPARAGVGADVADGQGEVLRRVQQVGIRRQRQVRLRHADGEVAEAVAHVLADLLLGLGIEVHVPRTVDLLADGLDLVLDRPVVLVERVERVRLLARVDDRRGEVGRADAALGEALVGLGAERAGLEREPLDELDLLVRVARPAVDGHDRGEAELLDDLQVAADVRHAGLDRRQALLAVDARVVGDAAVVLDC